ncbi:MAG: radical SAM protein [Porphyromonadaceae bacterium]|nr:radical SAM protein [Porphyromonadaceae bacterium]
MATILYKDIVFGPVHSRRLGISLGVNLLPVDGKICSFDCLYCECGYNAGRRSNRGFPSCEEVRLALQKRLSDMRDRGDKLDVITFAGNGEPTLHPEFAQVIEDTRSLRNLYYPTAKVSVLSNATCIHRPNVFAALHKVDNNILKLDAGLDVTVRRINRPVSPSFSVATLVEELCRFQGNLIIQSLFLQGEHEGCLLDNTTEEELLPWMAAIRRIAPKEVMIYTIDRETPEKSLKKISPEKLDEIARRVEAMGIKTQVAY